MGRAKRFMYSGLGLIIVAAVVFVFRDKIKEKVGQWFPSIGAKLDEIGG